MILTSLWKKKYHVTGKIMLSVSYIQSLLLWKKWTLTNDVITLVSLHNITQRTPLENSNLFIGCLNKISTNYGRNNTLLVLQQLHAAECYFFHKLWKKSNCGNISPTYFGSNNSVHLLYAVAECYFFHKKTKAVCYNCYFFHKL